MSAFGGKADIPRNAGSDLTRFADGLLPGRPLWYARLAWERFISDELQAWADGGDAEARFRRIERVARQESLDRLEIGERERAAIEAVAPLLDDPDALAALHKSLRAKPQAQPAWGPNEPPRRSVCALIGNRIRVE